jgi:hypothetical protein
MRKAPNYQPSFLSSLLKVLLKLAEIPLRIWQTRTGPQLTCGEKQ